MERTNPINPLLIEPKKLDHNTLLSLLKEWVSVRDAIKKSALKSVQTCVVRSIGWSAFESVFMADLPRTLSGVVLVLASVYTSVCDSLSVDSVFVARATPGSTITDPIVLSVFYSVGEAFDGYIGSLYPEIKKWECIENLGSYPWKSLRELWVSGYVPSFDGMVWRLHSGKNAKVVLEYEPRKGNIIRRIFSFFWNIYRRA